MTATSAGAAPGAGREPGRFAAEWRAGVMVWRREMIHFLRNRTGMAVSLLQPLLFLYILGIGLSRMFSGPGSSSDYMVFLFPGVLVMAAQAPAISVGASIVWDRESGFLREMLVAPVHRSTLLVGKCLGGATVAACQGGVVLASAGLTGIPYRLGMFAELLAELVLASLAMTVMGAVVAVRTRRVRTFHTVLTVLTAPLVFLSGLMFPVSAMPGWMAAVTVFNPLTYAVDAMRRTVLSHYDAPADSRLFDPVTWGGHAVPPLLSVALVAAFCAVMLAAASRAFSRTE